MGDSTHSFTTFAFICPQIMCMETRSINHLNRAYRLYVTTRWTTSTSDFWGTQLIQRPLCCITRLLMVFLFLPDSSGGSVHICLCSSCLWDGGGGGLLPVQRREEGVLRLFLWLWATNEAVEEELWAGGPSVGLTMTLHTGQLHISQRHLRDGTCSLLMV